MNRENVLEAVKKDGRVLRLASKELQNEKELVLEAVKNDGNALEYASEELQNDKEVVMEAMKQNGSALDYASEELKNDKEFILEGVKNDGFATLLYASEELKNDKEVVLEVVKTHGSALQFASEELKNDKEVVLEAVKGLGSNTLKYASKELKNDKEVVLEAVKSNGPALQYASEELKNDKEVVMEAMKNESSAFEYASDELYKEYKKTGMNDMMPLDWLWGCFQKEKEELFEKRLEEERKRTESVKNENQKILDSVLDSVGRRFRIPHSNLQIHREDKLGKGGFGSVFKADLTNEQGENKKEVAVKVISYGFQDNAKEVFKEFSRSLQFHHENVIQTFGFDDSRRNEIAIVMEKLDGNMHDYVRENVLTLQEKLEIMQKMTKGIKYLHGIEPNPFLHRDIKGENFLFKLDKDGELKDVKICDFGLAKAVTDSTRQTQVSAAGQGTKLWMAPESGRGLYSVKSDVYSLGITFWEVLFKEYPYQGHDVNHIYADVERKGLRPDLTLYENDKEENEGEVEDGHVPKLLKDLLQKCWSPDRKERPSTHDLILWFDENEMEILEIGDEHFPPLEVQEEKKKGSNARVFKVKKKEDEENGVDDEKLLHLVDSTDEKSKEELQKEVKSLKMENKSLNRGNKSLKSENKSLKKENETLRKYLECWKNL